MRYRGIELKQGNGYCSELSIGIMHKCDTERREKNLVNKIKRELGCIYNRYYVDTVLDDYMLVRGYKDFTFDESGIENLKRVYDIISQIKNIDVHMDVITDDWMIINGKECNNDCVKWDCFIGNLEW